MKWLKKKPMTVQDLDKSQILALWDYVAEQSQEYERQCKKARLKQKEEQIRQEQKAREQQVEEKKTAEPAEEKPKLAEPAEEIFNPEENRGRIQYSLRPSYDEDRVLDMDRFLDEARKDTALFTHPALQNTYFQWEKERAIRKTFSSEVLRRLEQDNIRPATFYKAAGLDKRVFHTLKSDYLYAPSRGTAIRCCFGLRLSYEESAELLKLAGYSLSPGLSRDLAIRFCLENKIYDVYNVDALLATLGEAPLS